MRYFLLLLSILTVVYPFKSVESASAKVPYFMYNAASSFNIDVALLYALCSVESNCKTVINHNDGTKDQKEQGIVSKSYGMFQIKLSTAKALGYAGKSVSDLLKPSVNTWYAAKYLSILYKRYGSTDKVLSAYNAGKAVSCNKRYVDKVLRAYVKYKIDHKL